MRLRSFKEFEGIKESERVYAWSAPRSLVIKYTLCQHILSVPSKKVSANDNEETIRADLARLNAIKAGSLVFTRFLITKGVIDLRVMDLAKRYRVRPTALYQLMYDLEARGIISPERSGRRLVLKPFDVAAIEKELQRRGYFSASVSKGD
jgi:hypothetical protein